MAYSTVPKTRRDGVITLSDLAAAHTLEVAYEDGNLSINTPQTYASQVFRDRGDTVAVREGDDQQITGTFSFHLRQFTDAVELGSILDFIRKTGIYSTNVSVGTAGSPYISQYCIDITYVADGTSVGDAAATQVILAKCVIDSYDFTEGDPDSVSLSFTCYGGSTIS
tara:strand:- start:8246 stop:8746 length:501 start_codon:yes stop_codon:yes gene_type:complete